MSSGVWALQLSRMEMPTIQPMSTRYLNARKIPSTFPPADMTLTVLILEAVTCSRVRGVSTALYKAYKTKTPAIGRQSLGWNRVASH